ncbi:MAG: hypothetical protein GEV03_11005 [Streptosporangiales bacterium]|nr:hypothetical protein [Streptosporangiales bacterium]
MTGVLVLGDIPSTGIAGASAERVVPGSDPQDHQTPDVPNPPATPALPPDDFLDLVRQRLGQAKIVVAVYPAWRPEPAKRYIQLARSALETEWLVGAPSDLPPLALSLVADQLAYLAPYVPPGVLVGLVSRLARETLAGAWVRSVAGLKHIPISLGQHVSSYLPGGFLVTASPQSGISRVKGGAQVGELPYRPVDPVQVLAVPADGDVDWFRGTLLPSVRPARVQFFQPQPLGSTYWGTKKYVEYVAFSSHPQALTHAAGSVRVRTCRWCGQIVAAPTCPFCGMTRHRPGGAAQGSAGGSAQGPDQGSARGPAGARDDGAQIGAQRAATGAAPAQAYGHVPSPTEPGSGVP